MNSYRALRLATIAYCLLVPVIVTLVIVDQETLPEELLVWSDSQPTPLIPFAIAVVALFGTIVASIALLAQKTWGARLHLFSTGACLLAGLCFGPSVASAASSFIASLWLLVSGFIYGLAFFTDALPSFPRTPNQSPEPTRGLGL